MTMDGVSYCEVAEMRNQINSLTKENDELKQSKEALVKTVAELTEKLSITESTLKDVRERLKLRVQNIIRSVIEILSFPLK